MGVTLSSLLIAAALALPGALAAATAQPAEVLEDAPAPKAAPAPAADTVKPAAPDTVARPEAAPADTSEMKASAAPVDSAAKVAAPVDSAPKAAEAAAPEVSVEPRAEGGPDDLTIEVDQSRSRNEGKSLPLAMLFSAALPGAGELYLKEQGKAKAFLLVEAGFWASLYVSFLAKESYLQSARNHASEYAGIDAGSKSESFLETMGAYRAYQEKQHRQDSYELTQILSGKREQDYDIKPVPENYWDFGSSANPENTRNWRRFQSTLRYYRGSKVAMSFAVGALALNRLGSMVNTLQTYKRTSARSAARWELTPDLGYELAGARLSLRF